MKKYSGQDIFVAIACGGTGGHLFPGVAVAEALKERGCETALIVSRKEVDQLALKGFPEKEVITVPAVPLVTGNFGGFANSFARSFLYLRSYFRHHRPNAVLAMGGFTSAGPIFAGKTARAITCLHEANSIAGKANRFLAPFVDKVFIGFSSAAAQLRNRSVQFTGTPVRSQVRLLGQERAREILGLEVADPVLLVMGGSQGATAINEAMLGVLPNLAQAMPKLQFVHLTGVASYEKVRAAYEQHPVRAVVRAFSNEMELIMSAATAAVSRAGASSLAEIAALQVPSLLIPYPSAADDHQYFNARAYAQAGGARMLVQSQLKPDLLLGELLQLLNDAQLRQRIRGELLKWHFPEAAQSIAESILRSVHASAETRAQEPVIKYAG